MSRVVFPASRETALAIGGAQRTVDVFKMNLLRDAMREGKAVDFLYDGKYRVVEVHAIGTSPKDGSLVMRGVQTAGQASRALPQWTLFSVSKIETLEVKPIQSQAPRDGYAQGDKGMQVIIAELAL